MSERLKNTIHAALWFEQNNPLDMLKFSVAGLWNTATSNQFFIPPTRSEIQSIFRIISQNGWVRIGFLSEFKTATHRLLSQKKEIYKVFLFARQTTDYYEPDSTFPLTIKQTAHNEEVARASITGVLVSNVRPYKTVLGELMYLADFQGTAEKPPIVMPIYVRQ